MAYTRYSIYAVARKKIEISELASKSRQRVLRVVFEMATESFPSRRIGMS